MADDPRELRVKITVANVDRMKLAFTVVWYAVWLLMTLFVGCVLWVHPDNIFLWFWMIFGITGVVVAPLSWLDLLTVYTFRRTGDHYEVLIASVFRSRAIRFAVADLIAFEIAEDNDGAGFPLITYRRDGSPTKLAVLAWQRQKAQRDIIATLDWQPAWSQGE